MTVGRWLSDNSTVFNTTAMNHILNLKRNTIIAKEEYISDDEIIKIRDKDDIIALKVEEITKLKTKKETKTSMEKLYGIQENS